MIVREFLKDGQCASDDPGYYVPRNRERKRVEQLLGRGSFGLNQTKNQMLAAAATPTACPGGEPDFSKGGDQSRREGVGPATDVSPIN